MLTAKTIRIAGRPARAIAEQGRLIELTPKKTRPPSSKSYVAQILSALEGLHWSDSHGAPSTEQAAQRVDGQARKEKAS